MLKTREGLCRCINPPKHRFIKGELYNYIMWSGEIKSTQREIFGLYKNGVFIRNITYNFAEYFIDILEEREIKLKNILK